MWNTRFSIHIPIRNNNYTTHVLFVKDFFYYVNFVIIIIAIIYIVICLLILYH